MSKAREISLGLRIDIDTLRGTKRGVPNLVALLTKHGLRGSFFFSVGPDNMGRNLWRLLRPAFFKKMLRSKAASLYGWDIVLMGTLWPGPMIGHRAADEIRQCANAGHEIGFHAWDHHRWQTKIETLSQAEIERDSRRGLARLTQIIGQPVTCAAAPAWRLSPAGLAARATLPLRYASDCRGESIFLPLDHHSRPSQPPQIPVTLPTYDEIIGQGGITPVNYNEYLLGLLRPGRLNVLTIHAEAEGASCLGLFADFLKQASQRRVRFCPLGELLTDGALPTAPMVRKELPGRDGWLSWQGPLADK